MNREGEFAVTAESLRAEFEAFVGVARTWILRSLYARLRETAPVFRTSFGFWFVTRYDLCQAIMRNDAGWSVSESSGQEGATPGFAFEVMAAHGADDGRTRSHSSASPGQHDLRRSWCRAAARGVIASVETQLDSLGDRSEIELFSDVAQMLPTRVILDVLGIGHEHVPTFVAVADALIACMNRLLTRQRLQMPTSGFSVRPTSWSSSPARARRHRATTC